MFLPSRVVLPSWDVTLTIDVEYADPAGDVASHLTESLHERLADRLVAAPRPGIYTLVLSIIAESKERAEATAVTMVDVAVNQMRGASVRTWQVHAIPSP